MILAAVHLNLRSIFHTAIFVSICCFTGGCVSKPGSWKIQVIDGQDSNAGRFSSMTFHEFSSGNRRMTISYEESNEDAIQVSVASGRRLNQNQCHNQNQCWGGFVFKSIKGHESFGARAPALAQDPDGIVYVVYVEPKITVVNPSPPAVITSDVAGRVRLAIGDPDSASDPNGYDWNCGEFGAQCELVAENAILTEPPSILYQPMLPQDRLHVVYVSYPDGELMHASRRINETDWVVIPVEEGNGVATGNQPLLFVSKTSDVVYLVYLDGGQAKLKTWDVFGWHANSDDMWGAGPVHHYAVGLPGDSGDSDLKRYAFVQGQCPQGGINAPNAGIRLWQTDSPNLLGGYTAPPVPTPNQPWIRRFCHPSVAFDNKNSIYISAHQEFFSSTGVSGGALALYRYDVNRTWVGSAGDTCETPTFNDDSDPTCLELIDNSSTVVGTFTSIAYDKLDLIISYYDQSNGDLKVAVGEAD